MTSRYARKALVAFVVVASILNIAVKPAPAAVTREEVEAAIKAGVNFLKKSQNPDGSWPGQPGTSELVLLALVTAGERPDDPIIARGILRTRRNMPGGQFGTYAVSLQTMALAAADPAANQDVIARNAAWLEGSQVRNAARGRNGFPNSYGSWSYHEAHGNTGDNSNTQYAVLGLNAASEAGVPISPAVWEAARNYWLACQRADGGWSYHAAGQRDSTASMTCAGISSLVITGQRLVRQEETLQGDQIHNCGRVPDFPLEAGINWLANHFRVDTNVGGADQWTLYYLYGLERAGRLTGRRYFGAHDWYREGAERFVAAQNAGSGAWLGGGGGPVVSSSFALLFLAKGRAPVLVNKLRYGEDWDNDLDDVRNLTDLVARDWKHLLTWQVVDPSSASVEDMLQAPIAFFNGHASPRMTAAASKRLRDYVDQGGFIFADACCGRFEFDRGFRFLMKAIFPEPQYELHVLSKEHPVYRARHILTPELHPLWGIEYGCRTVVIYSPTDLSCYWNQIPNQPENHAVILATRVGQNVVEYATGRTLPADKLEAREVVKNKVEPAKRGALEIAKLKHGGDWNVAPMAIPHLMQALRDRSRLDVVINHREIAANDPNLVSFPLSYVHGRAGLKFGAEELTALKRHLEPGGGMIFADAACGSPAFDKSFRKVLTEMFPDQPLIPIPQDDEIYTRNVGYDLADVQYTKALNSKQGYPELEGVKLNGHWAIVYSKWDIGCSLESPQGVDCKGYVHESAVRIATNMVQYSMLP